MNQVEVYEDEFLDAITDRVFRRCLTCNKYLDKKDPHIIAYKNSIPAYFCEEHMGNAKHYLDWYQEFVEASE